MPFSSALCWCVQHACVGYGSVSSTVCRFAQIVQVLVKFESEHCVVALEPRHHWAFVVQDLKKAMPDLGHGLQQLLDYPGDVEADLATTFSVEEDNFGELLTHELKPGGSQIAVTNSNRQEYVDLHTKWVLEDSIQTQFAAFDEGFYQVSLSVTQMHKNSIPHFSVASAVCMLSHTLLKDNKKMLLIS